MKKYQSFFFSENFQFLEGEIFYIFEYARFRNVREATLLNKIVNKIASFALVTSRQCHDKTGRLLTMPLNLNKSNKAKPDQSAHSRNLIRDFVLRLYRTIE